ncbi:MAG: Ig-like domain-containing protein [Kiritimatiellia bacterium]|jgi:hypothetical protein|nr:Ig-like domain-containing protein [Kiritimatiellia bacterium]
MNQIRYVLTVAFVAVAALFVTAVSAGALDNPGFEVPDQGAGGHTYAPAGASWTFTPAQSGLSGPNGPWKCNSTSPDPLGDQFGYLQNVSTISQDLSGLVTGATYTISFYESYRTAMSPSNDLAVVLDAGLGTEVTMYTNAGVTNPTWEARQTGQFVAAKTSYTLTFSASNPLGGDRSTLIDGVTLNTLASPGPPTVSALSPADDAFDVRVDSDLALTFSEYVQKGSGNIEVRESIGDAVIETIDVASAAVTVSGADVTINPTGDLAETTGYYVEIASGAIEDLSGSPFAGISSNSTWNFTTGVETFLTYHHITGDADSDISSNKTYTHALDFGTGTPGALINGVQFNAYNNAANGTLSFNRTISSGGLSDHGGNGNHNVSGSLVNLLTDMYYNGNNAAAGTTTWTLSGLTAGTVYDTRIYVRQWAVNSDRLVTLVFDPDGPGGVSDSTGLISEDDATSVGMAAGNDAYYISYIFTAVAGQDLEITATQNNINESWHLYGVSNEEIPLPDTTAPTVSTLYPTDDATNVLVVRDLVVTFDEDIAAGPGNITITNLTASTATVIAASNAQVSVAGPVLTINPTADLAPTNDYAVLIDSSAIKDVAGNPFEGITNNTVWNFTTAELDLTAPSFTTLSPLDDAVDMSTGADLMITFDEEIMKGTGSIQIKLTDDDTVFETIDVAGTAVTVNVSEVTINPSGNLAVATGYYVEIDPGVMKDLSENDFAGIAGNSTWNFTTLAAGLISYHQVADDTDSGIVSNRTYTHAIDFGNTGAATVNGVVFGTDVNVAAGGRANSGTRTYGPNFAAGTPPAVTGGITNVFKDFRYNGPDLGYVELTGLTAGRMYDLRLYERPWDYEGFVRTYYAGYDLGGDGSVEFTTPKIDQNRTTLFPPWLPGNVSWTMSYVYQADASGRIRVIIDLADDHTGTYHLFGLTNEELPTDGSIYWIGAGASNFTPTSARAYATVNTNMDEAILVWDRADKGTGSPSDWTNSVNLGAQPPGVVTGEATNLLADTRYVLRFYGTNSMPTNGWSAAYTFVTGLSAGQTPVFTNAAVSAWNAVSLGWQDNASNETAYILQRSTIDSEGPYSVLATLSAGTTSYLDVVTPGTTYYYQLAATNAANGSGTEFALCRTHVTMPPMPKFEGVLFRDDFSQTDTNFNQNVEDNLSLFGAVIDTMTQDAPTYTTSGNIGGEDGNATWRVGGANSSAFIPDYDFALDAAVTKAGWFTVSLKDLTPGGGWAALAVFDSQALGNQNITESTVGLGALFAPGPGGAIQVWSQANMATNPITTPAPPLRRDLCYHEHLRLRPWQQFRLRDSRQHECGRQRGKDQYRHHDELHPGGGMDWHIQRR